MSADSASSRSTSRRSRSKSRKPRFQFNSLNEAKVVLAILENRVRNMGAERNEMRKLEKQLTRINKAIEEQGEKMSERVRAAEAEMRCRLGLAPQPGWNQQGTNQMDVMGSEMDESTLSLTGTSGSRAASASSSRTATSDSSMTSSQWDRIAGRSYVERTMTPVPAISYYDEAIKHLDAATAQLKAIAISTIREDDELNYYTANAKLLIEKLKASKERIMQ